MATTPWEELSEVLREEPSELAFRALCSILDTWPGDAQEALRFAEQELASWPDECRLAPWSWCCAAAGGERKPTWDLVRAVQVPSTHLGCEPVVLGNVGRGCIGPQVTCLHLDRYAYLDGNDGAALLSADCQRWSGLRQVWGLDCEDKSLQTFLASGLPGQLQALELYIPGGRHRANVVAGFTHPANRLQELCINFPHSRDIRGLLAEELLPALTGLSLKGQYDGAVPERYLSLVELPLFARVERLALTSFPPEVVLPLLTRPDLHLERLELERVRSLGGSPRLESLTHLSVRNQAVGDDVLGLVEAATPGMLRTLELVKVGLTDEGLARLARMPQLSEVRFLNLQENSFGADGLAALLQSPHLGRLERLHLGGEANFSPYYYPETQAIGDRGAEALALSGLLAGLRELVFCSADVGPRGVAALARLEAPHLRRLNLAHNSLGPAGATALAACPLLPGLRELTLSQCEFDDGAVGILAGVRFRALRNLELAYNSIGPVGARHLAEAPALRALWRLNLHDNFIGDEGLIALAGSPHLGRLLELDLEQDAWNYRGALFGDDAARAVAQSRTFTRLDALFAGEVDEYAGARDRHPFSRPGQETVLASTWLRPEARWGLRQAQDRESEEVADQEAAEEERPVSHSRDHYTPREMERGRRGADFRDLPPLEVAMDDRQWREAVDPAWMFEFLGENVSARKLRLFACACARRVLPLYPDVHLPGLIHLAEQLADGKSSAEECRAALLAVAKGYQPPQPEDQVHVGVRIASYGTVKESAREAMQQAMKYSTGAVVADLRQRRNTVAYGTYTSEHVAQASLVRCIFGNPHHPVRLDPVWLTWNGGTVVALARGIYEEKAFGQLPILGDALEECGCTDAGLLEHCRSGEEHVRGCWVVDLVLDLV